MRSPAEGARPPSIIVAPKREHSRKPDEAYELIERMYPDLPKIELFARNPREGWSQWGNQVPLRVGHIAYELRPEAKKASEAAG
jgi:N6-adenosine-specific RNA methylase IME4